MHDFEFGLDCASEKDFVHKSKGFYGMRSCFDVGPEISSAHGPGSESYEQEKSQDKSDASLAACVRFAAIQRGNLALYLF